MSFIYTVSSPIRNLLTLSFLYILLITIWVTIVGWHNRINIRATRGKLDLYQLAPFLHDEAEFVTLQVSLISEKRLHRYQRKTFKKIQGRLSELWNQYDKREISTSKLLRACAHVYGPGAE